VNGDAQNQFEPSVQARELENDVAQLRRLAIDQLGREDGEITPRIVAHLDVYERGVESLIEMHRAVADETDVDLGAETRWTAIWELAGRCIGISRVLLHDLRGGFASEAIGTLRRRSQPRTVQADPGA